MTGGTIESTNGAVRIGASQYSAKSSEISGGKIHSGVAGKECVIPNGVPTAFKGGKYSGKGSIAPAAGYSWQEINETVNGKTYTWQIVPTVAAAKRR